MRDPSPYAGKTVQLRADALEIGSLPAAVVDWFENTDAKVTWQQALAAGDNRADSYNVRRARAGLPDDDDVLIGKIDGLTRLFHVTEVNGYVAPPAPPAPTDVSESEIGEPCPACGALLEQGDKVAVLILGPGADPAARAAFLAGQQGTVVAVELHWACRTGDTSYETPGA